MPDRNLLRWVEWWPTRTPQNLRVRKPVRRGDRQGLPMDGDEGGRVIRGSQIGAGR